MRMPFHVEIWPESTRQQTQRELYAFNLSDEALRQRFIDPYDYGRPITSGGRTLPGGDISYLKVFESDSELDEPAIRHTFREYENIRAQREVTDAWITGAPGNKSVQPAVTRDSLVAAPGAVDQIERLCRNFGRVARQLTRRHSNRSTLEITDEYDVQDLLHALLLTLFDDVRDETWQPHYLGRSTRVDLRLPAPGIIVEAKFARAGHADREIGDELAEDVSRYGSAQAAHAAPTLVCFVYDPQHIVANARGLERDLAATSHDRLRVVGIVDPL